MRLIDVLSYDLKMWPAGEDRAYQDFNGQIRFLGSGKNNCVIGSFLAENHRPKGEDVESLSDDYFITRIQFESANQSNFFKRWSGCGLPDCGAECELSSPVDFLTDSGLVNFDVGTIVVVGGVVNFGLGKFCAVKVKGTDFIKDVDPKILRPSRSDEERKMDGSIKAMREVLGHAGGLTDVTSIYRAISEGKIPGIKLED